MKLPISFDAEAMRVEIEALDPAAWVPHPEGFAGNSAVLLVSVDGDPTNHSVTGAMRPTEHLNALGSVQQIMAGLSSLGSPIGRSRLMRITEEAEVNDHVDTNRYWWEHLRIHLPVTTHESVRFHCDDQSVHMAAGECWAFDTWRRHRVENAGRVDRIHLVIDTVGGPGLWTLIDRMTGVVDPATPLPDLGDATTVTFESFNQPAVMTAGDIDLSLAALLNDLASVDPTAATQIDRALLGFRRSWRATWARFGAHPDGREHYEALRDQAQQTLAGLDAASAALPNQVTIIEAINQIVLRPALGAAPSPGPRPQQPPAAAVRRRPIRFDRPVFIVSPPRSGSTLLFETLTRARDALNVGGESHQIFEQFGALSPAGNDWDSNRLEARHATEENIELLNRGLIARLQNRDGVPARQSVPEGGPVRLVEKTPKNALRVPFLAAAYPDARFVYLYRDPRETLSSMYDAWKSGRFVTYRDLPEWTGEPWSLLLTPGWRDLNGKTLIEVVADQWITTTSTLLDDLAAIEPERWCVADYRAIIADPNTEMERLCAFLDLTWDRPVDGELPIARHTLDTPDPDKWRRNATELDAVWSSVDPVAARAHAIFAEAPQVEPAPRLRRETTEAHDAPETDLAEPDGNLPFDFSSEATNSFGEILDAIGSSLAVTTYQTGRLVLVRRQDSTLNTHLRRFGSPMGIAVQGPKLALGTLNSVHEFWDQPSAAPDNDACYMPRRTHVTGNVAIHDLAYDADGELWGVATRFSCLVNFEREYSFTPRWRPGFISGLSADDRCHLNGLAMVDGRPRYVTVLGMTDEPGGWRADKAAGGALLDIDGGPPIATDLCMPHSPRYHDGKLWLLQSGKGALCTVDLDTGAVETVIELPGFTRGLAFAGPFAFVGLSKVRETVFAGLPITQSNEPRHCGIWAIDIRTGTVAGYLRFKGSVAELYEVAILPGKRFPELVEPGAEMTNNSFILDQEALADVVVADTAG